MFNPFEALEQQLKALTGLVAELNRKIDGKPADDETPLTIDEAATYLKAAKQTLYHLTSRREIPHLKRGRKLYFLKADLDKWLKSHRKKTVEEIMEGM
jgi:excisionase family DNA binding protein